jgi:hypothetical protein
MSGQKTESNRGVTFAGGSVFDLTDDDIISPAGRQPAHKGCLDAMNWNTTGE